MKTDSVLQELADQAQEMGLYDDAYNPMIKMEAIPLDVKTLDALIVEVRNASFECGRELDNETKESYRPLMERATNAKRALWSFVAEISDRQKALMDALNGATKARDRWYGEAQRRGQEIDELTAKLADRNVT